MLKQLFIKDMLIISRLELEFEQGLNVLTGETGAGKSILLDSLGFVLGWRGRADLVRKGAEQGEVSAIFDVSQNAPAKKALIEAGLSEGDELILRRINAKDGRKTAWINDRRVSGELLRTISSILLELHGQHDDRGLLDPKGHQALLDQFARNASLLDKISEAWKVWNLAKKERDAAEIDLNALREEEEFLRHAVSELEELDPAVGEEAELDARRRLMKASEKLRGDIAKARQALGRDAAEGMMVDALRWLEDAASALEGQLDEAVEALSRALVALEESSGHIERSLDAMQFNPYELEQLEERLFAIRALARKHQVAPDDLTDLSQRLSARLMQLDGGQSDLADKTQAVTQARASYESLALRLSEARQSAATNLDLAMVSELGPLKMERAEFKTDIQTTTPSRTGQDAVSFLVSTNPGTPAGPLAKIASGGELSRFLLALKVCLRTTDDARTVIFDEIDRGVGGATADAVGRRLVQLASGGEQVLVVTHSPQVAALGTAHFRVEKTQAQDETFSTVVRLNLDERIDEIGRMLSGDTITAEARAAAKQLIDASIS